MKTLFKLHVVLIFSLLFFSACNSKLSVTKRHYTKGYFVAHTKSKAIKQKENTIVKSPVQEPVIISKVYPKENSYKTDEKSSNNNLISAEALPSPSSVNNSIEKDLKQSQTRTPNLYHPKNLIQPLKDLHKSYLSEKSQSGNSDGRGLSLFWVVILVLLILWFFGFIGGWGTGGLINILLVIALILLILWLLRII